MKSRKIAAALAVVAMASLAFAAPKKQVVTFWHIADQGTDKEFFDSAVAEFEKANPNVKIEVTNLQNEAFKDKLATVLQSKNPPDIFAGWGGGSLAEHASAKLLKDITKDVKADPDLSTISSGALTLFQYNGKQYGVPHDLGAVTFWYNKDILKEVGYDTFPTDWDDFITMCKKIKDAGYVPIAMAGGDKWPAMHFFSYLALRIGGKEVLAGFSADGAMPAGFKGFNDPAFIKAGEMIKEVADMGLFQTGFLAATQNDGAALVGNGKAAMELMGHWAPGVQNAQSASGKGIGDKLATAAFPAIKGGKGKVTEVIGGGNGFEVGKNASKEAVAFLKFLLSKKSLSKYASVSSIIPTVAGTEAAMTDNNMKQVKEVVGASTYYQLYLDQFLSPAAGAAVNDNVQAIMAGTKTPAKAMADIQKVYEE